MSMTRQMRRHQERLARKGKGVAVRPAKFTGEKLSCCALIDKDGVTHQRGFKSHAELRAALGRAEPYKADTSDTYGFWTSAGRFVDRDKALTIAVAAGQVSERFGGRELLSSDVNW